MTRAIDMYQETSRSRGARRMPKETCRASDVMGKAVKNDQGENLGKVNDLIVNLAAGRAPFAIITYRWGIGDRRHGCSGAH